MEKNRQSSPVSLRKVQVTDAFWKHEMELVRREVIPYQWEALNDRIPEADPSFCMRNFKIAGKITAQRKEMGADYKEVKWPIIFQPLPEDMEHMEDRFYGCLFQDSDFSKWIEAVGYSLTQHPDAELEKTADEAIDIVCAAQQENGYLDTYYIINDMSKVFTNLKDNHELYCFGHLTEGAVAYYQATGKDKLLKAAQRYADYIASCFGPEPDKKKGYPGHEIAEMALVRLYEATGDDKYLNLSRFFVDQRGTRPYYFDAEHPEAVKKGHEDELRYQYNQAHLPVREQDEAVGHAVRAVYLYSGMADIARLTGDEALYAACEKLWDNITRKKMYITGGIGATHMGEAFSFNYDLPNDTAYAETCASIGLVFFARRMLEIKADRKYADVMERALYNGILSGMALDGKSFFYVNPLESLPEACHKDERKFHVKPVRQKWFGCACCPPNVARLLSSIGGYAFEESPDSLYMNLFVGGKLQTVKDGKENQITVETRYPWAGQIKITVENKEDSTFALALRIPGWCQSYSLKVNKEPQEYSRNQGYAMLERTWKNGDEVLLTLDMPVQLVEANPLVREDLGKVAVTRGPLVYCLEETDNGKNLSGIYLEEDADFAIKEEPELLKGIVTIETQGKKVSQKGWNGETLYRTYQGKNYDPCSLKFIPYYAWTNRGIGEMTVWVKI